MADYLGMGEQTSFPSQVLDQEAAIANIANTRARTRHQDATTAYLGGMTREAEIRATQMEQEFDANKKIAEMSEIAMSEGDGGQVDPVEGLNKIANIYIKSGLVKKGSEILKQASQITAQQALAGARQTTAETAKAKADMAMIEKYSKMLGGVEDEDGWNLVKESILSDDPRLKGFVEKLGGYSPEKVRGYQAAMTSARDKAWIENAKKRTEIYQKLKAEQSASARTREALAREKHKLAVDRERRLEKNGGKTGTGKDAKPAGMPTKAEVGMAGEQLKALNVQADEGDQQEIAQQAKQLWKNNPGLTPTQATSQVIQKMIQAGDITPGTEKSQFFGMIKKKVPGELFSPNRPQALPSSADGFVKGQYYQTPQGIVKYVDGENDELVRPAGK